MLKNLKKIFQIDLSPADQILDDQTIWIQKPGIKEMRYIDVYESDLDIFLENGWEVWNDGDDKSKIL